MPGLYGVFRVGRARDWLVARRTNRSAAERLSRHLNRAALKTEPNPRLATLYFVCSLQAKGGKHGVAN
jgi:hypothetical protein